MFPFLESFTVGVIPTLMRSCSINFRRCFFPPPVVNDGGRKDRYVVGTLLLLFSERAGVGDGIRKKKLDDLGSFSCQLHSAPLIWASDIRLFLLFGQNILAPNSLP